MDKKNLKQKFKKVLHTFLHVNKYVVVLALGVVLVGFLGDNSVVAHLHYKSRINELKNEIAEHQAQTKANLEQTRLLQTDQRTQERIAREQYFFKMDDEDVFVLSDDDPNPLPPSANETVE